MKKTVKKWLSIMTIAVIVMAIMFSGCARSGDQVGVSDSTPKSGQEPTEQTGTKPLEQVTLKYAAFVSSKDEDGSYVEENVTKEFTKKYPHINVEFQLITDNDAAEYLTKTDLMVAAGDDIDILVYPRLDYLADRAKRGMLAPLDDYFKAEGLVYDKLFNINTAVDGKIYAIPNDATINFVMINKKYLDEAGLPIPPLDWTWDDYRDYAKAMTKGDGQNKRYGSYMHTWNDFKIYGPLNSYTFNPMLKEDGTSNITDPNIKDWLQFVYDLENVDKSQLPYYEAKAGKLAYRDIFFQGKAAMIPIGSWMVGEISRNIDKYPRDWKVAFAPVPKFKDYPAGSTCVGINMAAVNSNSKHKAEAFKLALFDGEEGVFIRAQGLPAKAVYDSDLILAKMVAGMDNYYDMPSLKAVLDNPKMKALAQSNIFSYSAKVKDAVDVGFEKFLVGGEGLDEAIANTDKAVKDIIAAGE